MPITYAEHERKLKSPAFCELLPLRDVLDNVMVRSSGAFVAGFNLRGFLSYFATDEDRNNEKAELEALLRSIPDESMRVQFRFEVCENIGDLLERYVEEQRTEDPLLLALDEERISIWKEKEAAGSYLDNQLEAYFIWDPRIHAKIHHSASQNRKLGGFSLSEKKCIARSKKEHETYLGEFESLLHGVVTSLEQARLGPQRLKTQELFDSLKFAQHPTRRSQKAYIPGEDLIEYRSARDQVAEVSILDETETYLNLDGYLYSVVSLKELPDGTLPGMLDRLRSLGLPLVICGQAYIPDQRKVLKSYKSRLKKMIAAQKDADGNYKSNPEAREAQKQLEQVQADLISSSLKTARLSLSVVIRTSSSADTFTQLERQEQELANRTQKVLNAFSHMNGAKAVVETLAKRRIWIGTLPGMGEIDKREHDMLSPNAADLLPVEMPWSGTPKSPLMIFETPFRQLIPFSVFSSEFSNANALIMGGTGSGKTVLMEQILLQSARANPLVTILECGDSYEALVSVMGSEMIAVSLDCNQTLNAWDLPHRTSTPDNRKLAFIKQLTRYMLGENPAPDLDIDLLDSLLLDAIRATYKRCSARTSDPIPLFNDLYAQLAHWQDRDRNQKIQDMARMAAMKLRPWVLDGPYAKLFDRPTTVPLDTSWLYFNIEALKEDPRLEAAMSILIAHTATERTSGIPGRAGLSVLDEIWRMLQIPVLGSLAEQLFRTGRKRDNSVFALSQGIVDYVGRGEEPNPYGAGIVTNANTKIVGMQNGDLSILQKHLYLNDTAINQIRRFSDPKKGVSSEFLIAIGQKAESTHILRVVPTPVEYWISTTYKREKTYRKWWLARHANMSQPEAYGLLAEKFPHGLADYDLLPEERSGAVLDLEEVAA